MNRILTGKDKVEGEDVYGRDVGGTVSKHDGRLVLLLHFTSSMFLSSTKKNKNLNTLLLKLMIICLLIWPSLSEFHFLMCKLRILLTSWNGVWALNEILHYDRVWHLWNSQFAIIVTISEIAAVDCLKDPICFQKKIIVGMSEHNQSNYFFLNTT